jgi:hypothetical protein
MLRVRPSFLLAQKRRPLHLYFEQIYISVSCLPVSISNRYTINMQRTTKSASLLLRMQPAIKQAGMKAAADDNRSLSALIETLLIEHLQANGYLPGSKAATKRK